MERVFPAPISLSAADWLAPLLGGDIFLGNVIADLMRHQVIDWRATPRTAGLLAALVQANFWRPYHRPSAPPKELHCCVDPHWRGEPPRLAAIEIAIVDYREPALHLHGQLVPHDELRFWDWFPMP